MPLSDCNLITGSQIDCRNSVGGIDTVYLTEFQNVPQANITVASGVVTAMSCSSGKKFWTYELEKENAEATETAQISVENGTVFYEGSVVLMLKKMTAAQKNNVETLAKNRLMVIIKDKNGLYWLMGRTAGADVTGAEAKTGKAFGDMNGYTLTITSKEATRFESVTSSLLATLTV